jgi:Mlc titration factor MtfA (ptsG expression regulator)
MRTTSPPVSRLGWGGLGAAIAMVVALGGVLLGPWGALAALALTVAPVALLRHRSAARWRTRRLALAAPFPDAWRQLLLEWCDHYVRLPDELRERFEDDLRILLAEKRISGVGIPVAEELRLLAAASAVTLSLGWPEYEWDQLTEILLYPDDFDRDYEVGIPDLAGQAHPWGTVILSVPALCQSFRDPDDAYHVGFHEFAHLLDLEQTHFDGIPAGYDDAQARRWVEIREREMEQMQRGTSVLDDYGAHDPVEFLAVAVEAFFEAALALRRSHRDLYELLAAYFQQDPAAWDDARGLVLEPPARPRMRRRGGPAARIRIRPRP